MNDPYQSDPPPPYPGYAGPADSTAYSGPADAIDSKPYNPYGGQPNSPPGLDQTGYNQGPPGQSGYGGGPPDQGYGAMPGYAPADYGQLPGQTYGAGQPGLPGQPGYGAGPPGLPGQPGYGAGPPGLPGQHIHINQQNTIIMNQDKATTSEAFIVKEEGEDKGCGDCYVNCKGRCGEGSCGLCCEKFWLCEQGNKWYSPAGKGVGWLIVLILFYLTGGVLCAVLALVGLIILCYCGGGGLVCGDS